MNKNFFNLQIIHFTIFTDFLFLCFKISLF